MKKSKRVILGVGHPWFFVAPKGHLYTDVRLYKKPLAQSSLTRDFSQQAIRLSFGEIGNWNKIRLVAEVLE